MTGYNGKIPIVEKLDQWLYLRGDRIQCQTDASSCRPRECNEPRICVSKAAPVSKLDLRSSHKESLLMNSLRLGRRALHESGVKPCRTVVSYRNARIRRSGSSEKAKIAFHHVVSAIRNRGPCNLMEISQRFSEELYLLIREFP